MVGATAQKKLLQLQTEVETDADWASAVLGQAGLSVVDVWPSWAGPCVAMRSKLIRFKLTEGGDAVHLFSANASAIEALARFREHSEPTWLLFGSGRLVCVYIGCDWPHLLRLVSSGQSTHQSLIWTLLGAYSLVGSG
ncbi:Thioredoxin domain-containing protein 3-like protein [Frankliniella fusca]|uniref:Thioredoxin domain-containing protein 3-like protein n=1 Tax=Frankliniella fusca TaxID=407009 RepID=A0AAE1HJA9_9NEOP|nr:Thioredoxin domain-containing protein 3-like protein [Frankliniella fusca]